MSRIEQILRCQTTVRWFAERATGAQHDGVDDALVAYANDRYDGALCATSDSASERIPDDVQDI